MIRRESTEWFVTAISGHTLSLAYGTAGGYFLQVSGFLGQFGVGRRFERCDVGA